MSFWICLCDLKLQIKGTSLEPKVEQLNEELRSRGIGFRPHYWLSDDWYSPDGIPGIAIPFYLAHPRLARLERKQLFEVEGGTHQWCMKILREAGHAIDTAFGLHQHLNYRRVFGNPQAPYPDYYQPKPSSKNFVLHLDMVRKHIPWKISLKPSQSGYVRVPDGKPDTKTGPPLRNSRLSTRSRNRSRTKKQSKKSRRKVDSLQNPENTAHAL